MFRQIHSSEIKTVMSNLGVHFTDDEIQEMMIEARPDSIFRTKYITI